MNNFEMSNICENHLSFVLSRSEVTFMSEKEKKWIVICEECDWKFGADD